MTVWIVVCVLGVLGVVAATLLVDAVMEWNHRRRYGDMCTRYRPCPECRHDEPPSNLDRRDGVTW
jgi:hypothetical protein